MKLRVERLKEIIRETVAEVILHELADPRLGFCTVTRVTLTDDIEHCKVYVSVFGDDGSKSKTMHALHEARGLIQKRVAKQLKTRTTPHIEIELDETIEKSFAVAEKIRAARATDPDGGKAPDEASKKDAEKSDNVKLGFDDEEL